MSTELPPDQPTASPEGPTLPVVLSIEDDPAILALLQALLESAGYTAYAAEDGPSGLARLEEGGIDLLLLDLMLPGMNGYEICRRVRASARAVYLPIIMLTALQTPEQRHAGFEAGADDYVTKPFDPEELLDRVQVWAQTRQRLKMLHAWAQREHQERAEVEMRVVVERAVQAQTQAALMAAIRVLAATIEARDPYTGGHVARVGAYTAAIARELGWPADRLPVLEFAAALHDLGKIGVEDRILRKDGPLDSAEQLKMRQHAIMGARILDSVPSLSEDSFLEMARSCALYHQEHYDGRGYPEGLAGSAIPLEARIVAVADTFDAMTTDRPYRAALPTSAAIAEIQRCAGTQFDPDVVAAFLRAVARGTIAAASP